VDDLLQQARSAFAGRYAIEREIGSGGMSHVFLAEDERHHRKVALKVLRPEIAAALGAKRFLREIEIAAQLAHPHILPLHDSGEAGGLLFYVMPFVEGESLRDRLERDRTVPIGEALRVLRDTADALAHAHAHGVVHRDIKPDNVMLSGRHALVTDFGVAKAVSEAGGGPQLTTAGVSLGTPAYMAPEQALASPDVDLRADLYAFGVLAYEMLAGQLPFAGPTAQAVMAAHVTQRPRPVLELRQDVPPPLAAAIMRCLEKNPGDRFQSADDLLAEIEGLLTPGAGVTPVGSAALAGLVPKGRRALVALIGGAVVVVGVAALLLVWRHTTKVAWARAQALPQLRLLADSFQYEPAFALAKQAERYLPDDSALGALLARISRRVNIRTEPAGATVLRLPYLASDSAWETLGTTPLGSIRIPYGMSRIRFERSGFLPLEVAYYPTDSAFRLDDGRGASAGMVRVRGATLDELYLPGLERVGSVTLGTYEIDATEVTNARYKVFVDSGGYRRREFWDQPFVLNGRTLSWEGAVGRFVDRTGRPGPATWEAGDYPQGQDDFPVSGVSWYEAMAFAKFVGKSLPTISHWAWAASTPLSGSIVPRSNFESQAPRAVGSSGGVGPFGTSDMAGNVREWCLNSSDGSRYILGGGWSDPTYAFNDAYSQPPFDRSPINGFRLVRYRPGDTTVAATARPAVRAFRDFSRERPVSDAVFRIYRRLYDYDRTPLRATLEQTDTSAEDWVRQRITFDAAYGGERVTAYLFLPRTGRPPYQTLVYFPGSNSIHTRTAEGALEVRAFDFVLKSGRAVMYPVYKGTYERGDSLASDYANESNFYREHVIMWAKDLRRSIDYLATRPDIDTTRLAYYGLSWGGFLGGLMPAVEPRFRTVVLYVAGLEQQRGQPEVEPINFLPRIRMPVLMLNGRYDYFFPVETSQRPFFRLLGTPPQLKRQVIYEGGHSVPRPQLITETLSWLDRYLGPVQ
jgi:dienelactone hydrolase